MEFRLREARMLGDGFLIAAGPVNAPAVPVEEDWMRAALATIAPELVTRWRTLGRSLASAESRATRAGAEAAQLKKERSALLTAGAAEDDLEAVAAAQRDAERDLRVATADVESLKAEHHKVQQAVVDEVGAAVNRVAADVANRLTDAKRAAEQRLLAALAEVLPDVASAWQAVNLLPTLGMQPASVVSGVWQMLAYPQAEQAEAEISESPRRKRQTAGVA